MAERRVTVGPEVGLHSRPAAEFVKIAESASFDVTLSKAGGEPVNAKSILAVLTLDARQGDGLVLRAEGEGAEELLEKLAAVCAQVE